MFEYKYYLDTTLYDGDTNPIKDIEKFEEVVERDYTLRGLVIKYPQRVKFTGLAYDYIKTLRDSDTFCGDIDFKLLVGRENGAFEEYQAGKIYVSTCVLDLNHCTVDAEIVDNSYFALIKNNYKCEAYLGADKSKNGLDITPTPQISIDTYVPSTGVLKRNVYGYDLYEALKFLVQFMSDGQIEFQSDYFENTTSGVDIKEGIGDNRIAVLNTRALRDSDSSIEIAGVYITFEKLWSNIAKLYNLWFTIIRDTNNQLVMKAERYDYFLESQTQHDLRFSQDLELSFFDQELYASVQMGSSINDYSQTTSDYIGYIPSMTWKTESYNIEGQCNVDSTLSLTSEIVTDHNVIAYQIMDATDDVNKDGYHCFLSYDEYPYSTYKANLYDMLNLGTYPNYYNKYLSNAEVALMTDFHGELRKDNDPGNILFDVNVQGGTNYAYYTTSNIIEFNTETADPGGDFDTGTYKWTCPNDGYYIFSGVLKITVNSWQYRTALTNPFSEFNTVMGMVITPNIAPAFGIGTSYVPPAPLGGGDFWSSLFFTGQVLELPWEFGQFYQAGDIEWLDITMTPKFSSTGGTFPAGVGSPLLNIDFDFNDSTWLMDYSVNGGILKPNDRDNILINKFALKNNIGYDNWKDIRENLKNPFALYIQPTEQTKVWIKSVKRSLLSGNIEAEFLTNNTNY